MNNIPLVSIIIPFYNRHDLVITALNYISLQTYKNIEVILIDDGSDYALEINDDFGLDMQLKRLKENKGPGYARRVGRQMAKGKYVCYLDSDDWWSDNFIEECVNVIESDPEIGMVYTNTVKVVNGKEVARRVKNYLPTRILPDLLVNTKRFWSTPSCLWKYDVSLVENWLVLRNHEDYLHDIYCSKITNKIRYVSTALTFNNHSAENRIIRDREEVKKALIKLTEISSLPSYTGISHFILLRMYQYKMYLKPIYIYRIVKLFYKEFGFTSLRYFEVIGVLFLLNYSSIRSYRLKSYMNLK